MTNSGGPWHNGMLEGNPCAASSFDGSSSLTLELDDAGSLIAYFPSIGLPDSIISQLEGALAASEVASADAPPPEDIKWVSGAGRRQWVAEFPERPLGWIGPRRWRKASWRLSGTEQLRPLELIRDTVEATIAALNDERLSERFNTVLVNRYDDGQASIKWHSDNDKWYYCSAAADSSDIKIASVSLGADRWFEFRSDPQTTPKELRQRVRLRLRSGSLLIMAGATQQRWQHALPKDDACRATRINLTFRRVMTGAEDPRLVCVQE